MNIFSDKISKGTIFEDIPVERLADAYLEFFALAGKIRSQLGSKSYLLDGYLSQLFGITRKAYDVVHSCGRESITGLYAICRAARHSEQAIRHRFFEEGREFIRSHSLEFQEDETQSYVYLALLANGYMKSSVHSYRQQLADALREGFDEIEFEHQYDSVCEQLGEEAPMERLNLLFQERFLAAPVTAVLYKSLDKQLLETLTYRDAESSLQVFQLLLEHRF